MHIWVQQNCARNSIIYIKEAWTPIDLICLNVKDHIDKQWIYHKQFNIDVDNYIVWLVWKSYVFNNEVHTHRLHISIWLALSTVLLSLTFVSGDTKSVQFHCMLLRYILEELRREKERRETFHSFWKDSE